MIQKESTKFEARNSKQIQMTKKHNVPNNLIRIPCFGFSRDLSSFGFQFVSDLVLRISDFVLPAALSI